MGPVAPFPGEPPGTQLRQQQNPTTEEPVIEAPKSARKFKIASVEFYRVETPFLIGVWIFFASIAKIGELQHFLLIRKIGAYNLVTTLTCKHKNVGKA